MPQRRALHRLALWSALLLCGLLGQVVNSDMSSAESPGSAPAAPRVFSVSIDSAINPGALGRLEHAIAVAEAGDASALIVQLDTPGGLISTTRDMVNAMARTELPIIVYVGPSGASATSAGAFILLAADVAVMHTGTNVGAATPVSGSGKDIEGAMGKKVMNDTRAFMRSIAEEHGRNAALAEQFVTDAHSLTANEALAQQLIDHVIHDTDQLLASLDGMPLSGGGDERSPLNLSGATIEPVSARLVDRLMTWIAQPQIAHLLISLGSLAIYVEIMSPGLALPGILGTVSVILGLVSLQTLPVNTGFQLLLLFGLALMIAEFFVSGFGVLGIGGAIAFVLGSLNLFDEPAIADDYHSIALPVSLGIAAVMVVTSLLIGSSLLGGERRRRLAGKTGEAMVNFDGNGHVLVGGKSYPAVSRQPLRHGERIRVTGRDEDGRLQVTPIE